MLSSAWRSDCTRHKDSFTDAIRRNFRSSSSPLWSPVSHFRFLRSCSLGTFVVYSKSYGSHHNSFRGCFPQVQDKNLTQKSHKIFTIFRAGVVAVINCISVKLAARGQAFTTFVSIVSLVMIIVLGFKHMAIAGEGRSSDLPVD